DAVYYALKSGEWLRNVWVLKKLIFIVFYEPSDVLLGLKRSKFGP
uniref:Bestrophin homolog n=1 Tax=Steinernema glaseri TaxID=37863 RepID=A0A1I7Y054_9BILA